MRARRSVGTRTIQLVAALAVAGALAGCGSSSSGSPSAGSNGPSQATPYQVVSVGKPIGPPPDRESLRAAQQRIAAVAATGDCSRVADLFTIGSASGESAASCELITSIGAKKPAGMEAYGKQVGVIDYATPTRGATLVMVRQADGLLHIAFPAAHGTAPTAGTPLGKGSDAVAASAAKALHSHDCDGFLAVADPNAGIGALGKRVACFLFVNDPVQIATFDAPQARLHPLGGNAFFAFYELDTPRSYVLAVLARGLSSGGGASGASGPYRYVASYPTDRTAPLPTG